MAFENIGYSENLLIFMAILHVTYCRQSISISNNYYCVLNDCCFVFTCLQYILTQILVINSPCRVSMMDWVGFGPKICGLIWIGF